MHTPFVRIAAALLGALAVAPGCVGSGVGVPWVDPESGEVPRTYEEIQTLIFDPYCATSGCHAGGAAPKGLSLEAGRSYELLVGVPSVELPELLRVAPGSAADSYLIVKVDAYDSRRVGSRMPRTGPPYLSDDQIRAMEAWINDGAAEDWEYQEDAGTDGGMGGGTDGGTDGGTTGGTDTGRTDTGGTDTGGTDTGGTDTGGAGGDTSDTAAAKEGS